LAINTDEAEAVLAILDKHNARAPITDVDWHRLFATEPYIRLKKRESAMHRDFTDDDFKTFVLSAELTARAALLRQTLEAWKQTDLTASARRVLAYLSEQAVIKAKVFPVIKPRPNSLVFDTESDPAIFAVSQPRGIGGEVRKYGRARTAPYRVFEHFRIGRVKTERRLA